MPTRRYFSNFAPRQTLANSIGSSDTTCQIAGSFAGWPTQFPFYATLGYGLSSAEIVQVTNIVGTTATIVRGADGSTPIAHPAGETMDQTAVRLDYDEANAHTSASSGVHGITGNVVGDTDAQTLSNKTLVNPIINGVEGALSVSGALTASGATSLQAATVAGLLTASGGIAIESINDWNSASVSGLVYASGSTLHGPISGKPFYGLIMNDTPTASGILQLAWQDAAASSVWMRVGNPLSGASWAKVSQPQDTGWVNLTVNSPYQAQAGSTPQARMVGNHVKWRGLVSNTGMAASGNYSSVITLPATITPPPEPLQFAMASSSGTAVAAIFLGQTASNTADFRLSATLGGYYSLDDVDYWTD